MADMKPTASNRMVAPVGHRSPIDAAMTPKEVLGILHRHVLLIIVITVLGLICGGATWYLLKSKFPQYTAKTYIEVLSPAEKDPMIMIAPQANKDILYGHRVTIASRIKQQNTLERLLSIENVRSTKWYQSFDGSVRKAYKYLDKYMGAYAQRDGDFVELSMTCRNAEEAAKIVNEMVSLFTSSQRDEKQQEVAAKLQQLRQQETQLTDEKRQAQTAMDDLRASTGITDLERPSGRYFQHTITIRLNALELEKNDVVLALGQVEATIANLEKLATGPISNQIEYAIERDPIMLSLAQNIAFQEAVLRGVLTKFGENHREVRKTQEVIEGIRAKREMRKSEIAEQTRQANLANAKDSYIVLMRRSDELENMRQEAEAKKKDLDRARVLYDQRLALRDERIAMLDQVKEQIEKLKIVHDDPETPKVRATAMALRPLEQDVSRKWWLWFPSGMIVGLLVGIGLAFLLELANDLVRTPRDVGKYLPVSLLGIIPDASEDDLAKGVELCHAVQQAPYSIISESYRRCRANLKLSGPEESHKTILVTSGSAGDGKTSVAANMAAAFVAEDSKVLFVDANFRQPESERLFPKSDAVGLDVGDMDPSFGLSSLLMGQCSQREAIRASGVEGLDVIDAGLLPANPTELLSSSRMADLIKEQRKNYDYIVIDSPPVLLVSDAKVLARFADATVLVFNASATRRGAALRTIGELRGVNAKIIGCVLLGAKAMKGGYFHEQFRSYKKYQSVQMAGAQA